jgi:hypothetical protein
MSLTSVKLAPAGFTWHKNRVHFKNIYPMIPAGITRKKMIVNFSKM